MKQLLIIVLFFPFLLFGQENPRTLQACIDSALMNNAQVRLAEIDVSIANSNLKSSQLNFLPTMNGSASHGYNWGQTIDPFTNSFATNQVRYNNFYLSSSVTLFSGLQNHYGRKIDGVDQEIKVLNKEIEKRNVVIEILGSYLQAKLNEEIVLLKAKHLSFSQEQVKKARLLEELEYDTKRKRLEAEAQEAKDYYELVQAKNDLRKSLFLLQTLIGKTPDSTFKLADSISFQNKIKVNEWRLNELHSKKNLFESKQFKGRLSPTLSLNGSIGSGYSENNKFLSPSGDFIPKPFDDQLNENFYQSLSVTLTVPIFNGVDFYTRITIKELEQEQVITESEQRAIERENTTLQNRLEVVNQKQALLSAKASFESYKQLFEDAQIQYENGAIDYYNYLQSKDAFFIAESEFIQAKYRLKFGEMIEYIWMN